MIPVVTPEEMAAIDATAPEPVEELIGRAGAATARAAVRLMGGTYGRRVVVVAGKGNNGNDGRDAAVRLRRRGVRVTIIPATEAPDVLPPADLVIDAAYGTGFRGDYTAPSTAATTLAVDIPSGVNGLTGQVSGRPMTADHTVTFAALKPGLLFPPGKALAGQVKVADIGLDVSRTRAGVVERADVVGWLPRRPPTAHKWEAALLLVAGSPGMTGAAALAAGAAQRAGAGMVRYVAPGTGPADLLDMPVEAVRLPVDDAPVPVGALSEPPRWETAVVGELGDGRLHALLIGPGLGADGTTTASVRRLISRLDPDLPLLVDGDGLTALAEDDPDQLRKQTTPAVLTPHDGEYARLMGQAPGPDRCEAARRLADRAGAVVLLKGPTAVVANPDGRVRLVTTGDQRLATAGTGDVLSGIIGALLAQKVAPFDAAAAGAWLHGSAAGRSTGFGLVASDIVTALPGALTALRPS